MVDEGATQELARSGFFFFALRGPVAPMPWSKWLLEQAFHSDCDCLTPSVFVRDATCIQRCCLRFSSMLRVSKLSATPGTLRPPWTGYLALGVRQTRATPSSWDLLARQPHRQTQGLVDAVSRSAPQLHAACHFWERGSTSSRRAPCGRATMRRLLRTSGVSRRRCAPAGQASNTRMIRASGVRRPRVLAVALMKSPKLPWPSDTSRHCISLSPPLPCVCSQRPKVAARSFRLWLVCHWPDTYLDAGGNFKRGVLAPCRVPQGTFPGTLNCAHASYFHTSMPMLVGKHGLEISSARATLERQTQRIGADDLTAWDLIRHALASFQAQVEVTVSVAMGIRGSSPSFVLSVFTVPNAACSVPPRRPSSRCPFEGSRLVYAACCRLRSTTMA